jgi:hypothetical protein
MSKEADSKPYVPGEYEDELALMNYRKQAAGQLPPTSEIAQLAAMLTHGNGNLTDENQIASITRWLCTL